MGMFGAIWALIAGGAIAKDKIKGSIKDSQKRTAAIYKEKNIDNTYVDHLGQLRDISTNQKRNYRLNLDTKDVMLTDVYGKEVKNISEIRRKRDKEKAIKEDFVGKTVIEHSKGPTVSREAGTGKLNIMGFRYQDIHTNDIYVVRRFYKSKNDKSKWPVYIKELNEAFSSDLFFQCSFYMSIETGKLIRVTDQEVCGRLKEEEKIQRLGDDYKPKTLITTQAKIDLFIKLFNEYQDRMRLKVDFTDWEEFNRFYWNYYL